MTRSNMPPKTPQTYRHRDPSVPRPALLVGGCAIAIAIGVGAWMRFSDDLGARLPPMPPRPPPPTAEDVRRTDFTPEMFKAYIGRDAETYGIDAPDPARLADVFPYRFTEPKQVLGATPYEAPGLRLSVRTETLSAQAESGNYRAEHLVLKIENLTDSHLAYRISTSPGVGDARCSAKASIGHDAIALRPHETIERTECLAPPQARVRVDSVETMVIPELSYYYVSRLYPPQVGYDQRTTRGHEPPKGSPCKFLPEQQIRKGFADGTLSWQDVIDFYARHRCETYLFVPGYRAFTRANELPLPVDRGGVPAPPR